MKVPLVALLTVVFMISASFYSVAHSSSHTFYNTENSCNIDLNGGVRIKADSITFLADNKVIYRIINDDKLVIKNESIHLTAKQQALVHDYATNIRSVVPQVKNIALKAVDFAIGGINIAFGELLGKDNQAINNLTIELAEVRTEVDHYFTQNTTIYFDENGINGAEFLDKNFEQRIENLVEKTIQNSIGNLLLAFGQEILTSGDDMSDFEGKMENFGKRIEQEMDSKTQKLKQEASGLCQAIAHIDTLEEQLKKEFPTLANTNTLTIVKR